MNFFQRLCCTTLPKPQQQPSNAQQVPRPEAAPQGDQQPRSQSPEPRIVRFESHDQSLSPVKQQSSPNRAHDLNTSQASASTNATMATMQQKIEEDRRRARAKEAEKEQMSRFSMTILKERLAFLVPMQKLYEKIYFDGFDLEQACKPYDALKDETITHVDFCRVLLNNVESLSVQEAQELTMYAPRLRSQYELEYAQAQERFGRGFQKRFAAEMKKSNDESRIFYVRMARVLQDLAVLEIPINQLYDRFNPVIEHATPPDERTPAEKDSSEVFDFQDPRLQHLKVNYSRDVLQVENITFVNNVRAYRAALDEIIKFNQFVCEFNYVQEFYARICLNIMKKHLIRDYLTLFRRYDMDRDDLLVKKDIHQMMVDAGMRHVTTAESTFVFHIIGKFKSTMNARTFINWAHSMQGQTQKELIQYSEYLNVAKMVMERPKDDPVATSVQQKFVAAMRGINDAYVEKVVPDCVRILVNECNSLGETLMRHTLNQFAYGSGKKGVGNLITITDLINVIQMFNYRCSQVDNYELSFWIFNKNLLADVPKHFREEVTFVDTTALINCLKQEYINLGLTPAFKPEPHAQSMKGAQEETRDFILRQKASQIISILQIFQRNAIQDLIGERELRKILFEYLSQAHDHYITTIVSNLRFSQPPNMSHFFRQFHIQEVIDVIRKLFLNESPGIPTEGLSIEDIRDEIEEESELENAGATGASNMANITYSSTMQGSARKRSLRKQSTLTEMNKVINEAYLKNHEEEKLRQAERDEVANKQQLIEQPREPYLELQGLIGEVYLANKHEFEPRRLTRCQEAEQVNKVLDKLHKYLQTVPQVSDLPHYAKESRLRSSLDFLKNQIGSIDRNNDGFIPAGGLILLFNSNLDVLSIAETRTLAEYFIKQNGQEIPEASMSSVQSFKPFLESQIRVSFMLQILESVLQVRY